MQTRAIGMAVVELGGGRRKATDAIDARVGLTQVQPLGATLQKGDPMAFVHAADVVSAHRAVAQLQQAFVLEDDNNNATKSWQAPLVLGSFCAEPVL
jgi:thymidine phosphorylase